MIQINQKQFQEILNKLNGPTITTLITKTIPELINCPLKNIVKITHLNGIIQWNYQNAVNNQRIKENKKPNFQAKQRTWGTKIPNSPFIQYQQNLYLQLKVQNVYKIKYFHNKQEIDPTPYLKRKSESKRQNLSQPVITRDYLLNHILFCTLNLQHYQIS